MYLNVLFNKEVLISIFVVIFKGDIFGVVRKELVVFRNFVGLSMFFYFGESFFIFFLVLRICICIFFFLEDDVRNF